MTLEQQKLLEEHFKRNDNVRYNMLESCKCDGESCWMIWNVQLLDQCYTLKL